MKLAKKLVKKTFSLAGLNVSRIVKIPPAEPVVAPPPPYVKPSPLVSLNIDLLFDVGANIGQYATDMRKAGYKNRIVSFEPLPVAHATLVENAAKDADWVAHERCAIGDAPGEATVNIAGNSWSSSLLPMMAAHSDSAPDSIYVGTAAVKVVTLDSLFDGYARDNDRVFLKIDTQGFEKQVLDGARRCLDRIIGVQLELSIAELYASQQLYEYFFEFFKQRGFYLWSLDPGFFNPATGQLLQFDGVFVRKGF